MAMVLVKREKPGKWVVTKFVREHNHPLEFLHKNVVQICILTRIRELSSQLHYANQQLEACQEQLRTVATFLEKHTQCLSKTVESVVTNVRQVESCEHEISSHWLKQVAK